MCTVQHYQLSSPCYSLDPDLIHLTAGSLCLFTNLHLPQPLPPMTTFLLSISVSLTSSFLNIPHVSDTVQYFSFSVWFIYLAQCLPELPFDRLKNQISEKLSNMSKSIQLAEARSAPEKWTSATFSLMASAGTLAS